MSKEIEYIIEESLSPDRYCLVHNYIVSLQQKVEQLENIRKETIEYIKKNLTIGSILDGKKAYCLNSYSFDYEDLLNILNKGDNNVKDNL